MAVMRRKDEELESMYGKPYVVPSAFIRICNSRDAAMLLHQIYYWSCTSDAGEFYHTDDQFCQELSLKKTTLRRLKNQLSRWGFIVLKVKGKGSSNIKTYYRFNNDIVKIAIKNFNIDKDESICRNPTDANVGIRQIKETKAKRLKSSSSSSKDYIANEVEELAPKLVEREPKLLPEEPELVTGVIQAELERAYLDLESLKAEAKLDDLIHLLQTPEKIIQQPRRSMALESKTSILIAESLYEPSLEADKKIVLEKANTMTSFPQHFMQMMEIFPRNPNRANIKWDKTYGAYEATVEKYGIEMVHAWVKLYAKEVEGAVASLQGQALDFYYSQMPFPNYWFEWGKYQKYNHAPKPEVKTETFNKVKPGETWTSDREAIDLATRYMITWTPQPYQRHEWGHKIRAGFTPDQVIPVTLGHHIWRLYKQSKDNQSLHYLFHAIDSLLNLTNSRALRVDGCDSAREAFIAMHNQMTSKKETVEETHHTTPTECNSNAHTSPPAVDEMVSGTYPGKGVQDAVVDPVCEDLRSMVAIAAVVEESMVTAKIGDKVA